MTHSSGYKRKTYHSPPSSGRGRGRGPFSPISSNNIVSDDYLLAFNGALFHFDSSTIYNIHMQQAERHQHQSWLQRQH